MLEGANDNTITKGITDSLLNTFIPISAARHIEWLVRQQKNGSWSEYEADLGAEKGQGAPPARDRS